MDQQVAKEVVKELRNQKGWSQSDLSSLSGLSVKTIQRIERGQGAPSLDTAKALAAVFDRPFSDFLPSLPSQPSTETSAQQHSDSAEPIETASSQESANMYAHLLHGAERYWRHAVITVFVVTFFGLFTKLYQDVQTLSVTVSELASAMASESASNPRGITSSTSTNLRLRRENGSFVDYYGDQALQHAFHAIEETEDNIGRVTLLELIMLRDTAKIVTAWEDTAKSNSDVSTSQALSNYLQCYSNTRSFSLSLSSVSENIEKMQNCVYGVLADAEWEVNPTMDQALINLAHRMEDTGPYYKQFTLPVSAEIKNF